MEGRQASDQAAIHLLGVGTERIAGAQARLDVADRNALVKRSEGAGQCCRRIALDEDESGLVSGENRVESPQDTNAQLVGRLPRLHETEVMIDTKADQADERFGEGLVLCR